MKLPVAATLRFTFRLLSTALLHRRSAAITIAAAAAVLALAGCGGVSANTTSPSPSPSPTPNSGPSPSPTPTPVAPSSVNIPTWHMDNGRSGLNSNETQLTPANVNAAGFGKLFSYAVDGYSYAQPLYISNLRINGSSHNVVFVATEMASVYAFDADNFGDGNPLWKTSLLQPGDVPQPGGNPQPAQGLTSTPVIDTGSNTMYLVTAQKSSTGAFSFRLHAVDITTGQEHDNSPAAIHASVPGTNSEAVNGTITLNNGCLQRAALLLSRGTLYIGFSACPTGWLLSYDAASLNQIAV
ncbi:MAG TPA: pyrrolo-quinoline quinone, partial [Candidatus Angelobacter sp.]